MLFFEQFASKSISIFTFFGRLHSHARLLAGRRRFVMILSSGVRRVADNKDLLIVLVYGNVQTDNAVQLCSMITSLRQFSLKISTIYIFLFSKPFEVHKSTPFGLISLQNVVSWAIRKQKYIYFHIFWPASLPRPAASWATSLCYDFEFGRAPRGGQKSSTNTIPLVS